MAEIEIIPTTKEEIVKIAENQAAEGYRLIQIACSRTPAEMDMIYTFETKDYQSVSYKMPVDTASPVPSISGVFHYAFMYENEIHDLYGVTVEGMAVDFKGTLYETAKKHAFGAEQESVKVIVSESKSEA